MIREVQDLGIKNGSLSRQAVRTACIADTDLWRTALAMLDRNRWHQGMMQCDEF